MNNFLNNKPLLLSLAVNVFLAAFVMGRLSAPSVQLTPSLAGGPDGFGGPHGFGGPGGPHGFGGPHGPDGFGPPGSGAHAGAAAALSMFRPEDLFTREEMDKNTDELQPDFDKIKSLREGLATKLKDGAVTEDDIMVNFAAVDQAMADVQATMQQKAAKKIAALPAEERARLAERLLHNRGPHHGGPGHDGPHGDGPEGQGPDGHELNGHGPEGRGPDGRGPDGFGPPGDDRPPPPPPREDGPPGMNQDQGGNGPPPPP